MQKELSEAAAAGYRILNGTHQTRGKSDGELMVLLEKVMSLIPIGATGYVAEELWKVMGSFESLYPEHISLKPLYLNMGRRVE